MIIDFHTHVFPDQLAPRALLSMTENIDNIYPPVTDMTVKSLLAYMDKWNIDISVVQPVVTKATQVQNANKFAQSICSSRLISFGGIYPHTDDYKRDIDYVISLGLKGLKFHAEYQDFVLDDPYMLKIYDYAFSKGLIILHHAGFDPVGTAPFKSDPKRFAHVADEMKGGILIAAHLGGHAQWDDVERYLVGKNIYLDTAMGSQYYSKDQFLRIVKAHGADKILFASDSPWSDAGHEIEYMNSLPLLKDDIQKILGANAKRILGI